MDTVTMKFIVILTVFNVLQVHCDRSNKRFVNQLRNFKREMRADLTYIERDISNLFDTIDDLKKSRTIANEYPLGNKTIEQGGKCAVECREVIDEIGQVNAAIIKGLESEKRLNRQLQSKLQALESERRKNRKLQNKIHALESEVRLNRQLQKKVQALESEMRINRQLQSKLQVLETDNQNKLKNFENALSDIAIDMDKFMTYVNDTIQKPVTVRSTNNPDETSTASITKASILSYWSDIMEEYEYSDYDNMVKDTTTSVSVISRELLLTSYCARADRSGVFGIYLEPINKVRTVYCDADTDGGSWIVIMRRQDGSVDFDRNWDEYKNGFGDIDGEFWIGNDLIHTLTKSKSMELRIDMEDFGGNKAYAKYRHFRIGSESEKYILRVGGYSGTAGDSLADAEYVVQHNGMPFTTKDMDNDLVYPNCAKGLGGGWWFHGCGVSMLTGKHGDKESLNRQLGIYWHSWTNIDRYPKYVDMKIR